MCDVIRCKQPSKHFYRLSRLRFGYCDGHKRIPDKIIYNLKQGFYMSWLSRDKNGMPT